MTRILTQIFMTVLCVSQASAATYQSSWRGRDFTCSDVPQPRQLQIDRPAPSADVCRNRGTSVLAITADHRLILCQNSRVFDYFDISIGSNGVGKTTEGDNKTPLGRYPLAPPRFSNLFGIYIHIGYPTAEQVAQGYTGHSVGIHGPPRRWRCNGVSNLAVDWTRGCLGLPDDGFVTRIATWLNAHPEGLVINIE